MFSLIDLFSYVLFSPHIFHPTYVFPNLFPFALLRYYENEGLTFKVFQREIDT